MTTHRRLTVPRITVEIVQRYFQKLATGNPYFVYEQGRGAMQGCALRVQRSSIQIGLRFHRGAGWMKVATLRPDISVEELETCREVVRLRRRELEAEDHTPVLCQGRRMTVRQLWEIYREDYLRRRHARRSPRTLEHREGLWSCHLLPLFGELTLRELANLPTHRIAEIPLAVQTRVTASRPWAQGRHTANHALAAFRMAWEFARKRGWITQDPFLDVDPLDISSSRVFLEDADLFAVGEALRQLEARAAVASRSSRHVPSLGALLALRIVAYTGCRHREELLKGKLGWLRRDFGIPRLEVPRAKGDRRGRQGRVLYLGPHGLHCLLSIPRHPGCDDLVPGRVAGTQMFRLNEVWERVLQEARRILESRSRRGEPSTILHARLAGDPPREGQVRLDVKSLRHTLKTAHPRAGISSEHSRQLMGHEAASLGDRVYLHEHGPSLSAAAAHAEQLIRQLLGDFQESAALPCPPRT